MSGFHAKCVAEQPGPHKKARGAALTSKPFCDCKPCACPDCPDILKMLAITVTENSCDFGSKVKGKKKPRKKPQPPPQKSSLLDVLNNERECGCEVVARAVRPHVHTNLGLTERREATNAAGGSIRIPKLDPE